MKSVKNEIESVVRNGNCTGCGWCAAMFDGVNMKLSDAGFMRPVTEEPANGSLKEDIRRFRAACPGVQVRAPAIGPHMKVHDVFGPYLAVFEGWATDPEFRQQGSSAGVLTALSNFLVHRDRKPGLMAGAAKEDERRTVPVSITTKEEALAAAGSRYAPVAVASQAGMDSSSVTGKPCEIAALRADSQDNRSPVLLSFFCAGTPSQAATAQLIRELGGDGNDVSTLRYRGNGWPGEFVLVSKEGERFSTSYEESWGNVLGRQIQARCKVCVDGTGEAADVAVGDYWEASPDGYPVFSEQAGRSVVIARTVGGLKLLRECAAAEIITIRELSIDNLMSVQPLQVKRRRTLPGRLMGKLMTGQRIPRYPGYPLMRAFLRSPLANVRAALGSVRRGALAMCTRQGGSQH